jgi:hypothetical protein
LRALELRAIDSRADYWMEQPRRDRLLIPSLSADPFEEVRLIHRRA